MHRHLYTHHNQKNIIGADNIKILLINPPHTYIEGSRDILISIPLGLLYIGGVLEKAGHNVHVLDSLFLKNKIVIKKTGTTTRLGAPWKEISHEIKKISPDFVGITNPFTTQIDNAIEMAKKVKEYDSDIPVVIGGPHATVRPFDFIKHDSVDIAVMGEGEYIMRDLALCFDGRMDLANIKGIAYKKNSKLIQNERAPFIKNLDEIAFPAYHLINLNKYLTDKSYLSKIRQLPDLSMRQISIISSRGCPFNCIFCSINLHMGRVWRAHTAEYIVNHIEYLYNKYKINLIHFEDDNFTLDMKRCSEILDMLIERKIDIKWDTPNGIRADRVNRKLLTKMKKSGCIQLAVSAESGNQKVLDNIVDKKLNLNSITRISSECKKIGIPLKCYFVVGMPGETKKNINETYRFALMLRKKYNVRPLMNRATPLHETRLYNICKEKCYLISEPNPENIIQSSPSNLAGGLIKTEEFDPILLKKYYNNFKLKLALMDIVDTVHDSAHRKIVYRFIQKKYIYPLFDRIRMVTSKSPDVSSEKKFKK